MDKPRFQGMLYRYTIMMEPQDKQWVYALDLPAEYPHQLKKNGLYQLINTDNPKKRAEYKMTSYTRYQTGYITKMEYRHNLQLPGEPSERIIQLVKQLHGFDQPAEAFIQSVLNHYKTEKFHYTLMPPLMEENPIETFLFEKRYGFCSHYATAFVYLMRVAGIPARVVGGYQGGELNKTGNFLEIRQANAHAWVEVWLKNKGWTRFDPTASIAPERVEQDVNIDLQIATGAINFTPANTNTDKVLSWVKQARQFWGSIDYNWKRWVINYTSFNQTRFLSSIGIHDMKTMAFWLFVFICFMAALFDWTALRTKKLAIDKDLKHYQLFCKKLAKAGFHKANGETAQQFSKRIKEHRPDLADKVDKITRLFIKIRYQQDNAENDILSLKKLILNFNTRL